MLKLSLITVALVAATSQGVLAQQPPADAGRQIQQIPPPPAVPQPAPDIRIERSAAPAPAVSEGVKVRVSTLQLTGQTLFPEAELIAAAGFRPGAEYTLGEMHGLAARITGFYNSRGYVLAQAYLPAQDIQNGAVTIAVVEGRYGEINLRNRSTLRDSVAHELLEGLRPGDPVANAPLERRLLILSDVPGVQVRSTLSPGAAVGAADLLVELDPGRRVTGSIEADNAGNRYTGEARVGGTINFNNPTGHGDVASLRVLSSFAGLTYVRAAYDAQVSDATVGFGYAHVDYSLGQEFESLKAEGTADVFGVYAAYPLVRSRNTNLHTVFSAEAKSFTDKIGLTQSESERRARVFVAGLNGERRDDFGGGGWTTFSIGATAGDLDIQTPSVRAADAATARSNGGFSKLQFGLDRVQTLTGALSLYGAVRGQIASKNLDSSEKMELGGAYAVRAYPQGEVYGDQGYVATVEARLLLPAASAVPGRVQLLGFIDTGAVTLAKDPWLAGSNDARRSGYGVGLTWLAPRDVFLKVSHARTLDDDKGVSAPGKSGQTWIQVAKHF